MIPPTTTILYQDLIAGMDAGRLKAIVSKALGEDVTLNTWQVAPLGAIDFSVQVGSGGVYRVWGTAVTARETQRNWSLVVKILKSPAGCIMPNGLQISEEMAGDQKAFGYWRREALVAQSSLAIDLPPGLAPPRYYEVMDLGDNIWLWQEEVGDDRLWSWTDYQEAAYQLGLWQGKYAAGSRPVPASPWLAEQWLAQWVNLPLTGIMTMIEETKGWEHPLIHAYFAAEEVGQLQALWARRNDLLKALSHLPQTLCHMDAYRSNLFWQGQHLRLIDWSFTGMGAVGEELAAFVGAALLLDHIPLDQAERLEEVAVAGYLAGLRDAGWRGKKAAVITAYHCAMPLRYALMSLASMLRSTIDPGYAADWSSQAGKTLPELLGHRAGLIRFFLTKCPTMDSREPQLAR